MPCWFRQIRKVQFQADWKTTGKPNGHDAFDTLQPSRNEAISGVISFAKNTLFRHVQTFRKRLIGFLRVLICFDWFLFKTLGMLSISCRHVKFKLCFRYTYMLVVSCIFDIAWYLSTYSIETWYNSPFNPMTYRIGHPFHLPPSLYLGSRRKLFPTFELPMQLLAAWPQKHGGRSCFFLGGIGSIRRQHKNWKTNNKQPTTMKNTLKKKNNNHFFPKIWRCFLEANLDHFRGDWVLGSSQICVQTLPECSTQHAFMLWQWQLRII